MAKTSQSNNRLLTALPRSAYRILRPQLEQVPLEFGKTIYEAGKPIRHVYFPESGIISLLSGVGGNNTIEVGIVGNEGVVGLPIILGVKISSNKAIVQGFGSALRMGAANFTKYVQENIKARLLMLRYMHSLYTQISQSAACNRFHKIDERLARWLLMTQDGMGSKEFRITQEFLSNMLGVRREGVNKAAGVLQERKLVSYVRGIVTVRNRKKLERAACSCYQVIRSERDWE